MSVIHVFIEFRSFSCKSYCYVAVLKGYPVFDAYKKDYDFSIGSNGMDNVGISEFSLRMVNLIMFKDLVQLR